MGTSHTSRNRRRRRGFFEAKRESRSKDGWVLYLMVHIPFIWWWKIGITGRTATARARDIDDAVFGFLIPVFFVVVPGAYFIEQFLHGICFGLKADFYKGDGHTEFFWFPAVIVALPVMLFIWGCYFWAFDKVTGIGALPLYLDTLQVLLSWIIHVFIFRR